METVGIEHPVPELPEVETVVRELRPLLTGRRIATVEAGPKQLRRRWLPDWGPRLQGRRIQAIRRRGKWIIVDLDEDVHLLVHLGMTGQLTVKPARLDREAHTHLVLSLADGRKQLRFRDPRRFGSATLWTDGQELERFFTAAKLGPEPFDLDAASWRQRLAATHRCLKAVLLDQRILAGVGNIYADEALFRARLHPARLAHRVSAAEANRLRQAVVAVLNDAIVRRGSSIRDYVGGSGARGEFQKEFQVYGRTKLPCPRCGTPIRCLRLAGRSSHFCPECQPLKPRRAGQTTDVVS
jgi:formamidopyrimidine-DNA glycosylase